MSTGKGLGSILAGFLFKQVGERWTFRVYAIISACLLVLYAFLNYVVFKAHASAAQPQSQEVKSGRLFFVEFHRIMIIVMMSMIMSVR